VKEAIEALAQERKDLLAERQSFNINAQQGRGTKPVPNQQDIDDATLQLIPSSLRRRVPVNHQ
jgi:hypothetical protein